MRILVVSATPWNNNNSFGISYSNIFKGINDMEFANISFSRILEQTDSEIVSKSFQITPKMLVKNLINKKAHVGVQGYVSIEKQNEQNIEQTTVLKFAKKRRWQILFWARDLIWKIGRWKSQELIDFIDDFNPDMLFVPIYFSSYLNDILQFIKEYTNVPMIGYISDDCYTLRQFSLSPLYWIDRLYKRRKVRKSIEQCELLYVISDIQKEEYEKIFTPPCKILTKCADFSGEAPLSNISEDELHLVYAGNISKGRGESLSYITEAVEALNKEGKNIKFDIYSGTPLTKKLNESLNRQGSAFRGRVSYEEVRESEKNADIVIHVEGLSLKERLAVHQSFSTKLVDFFEMGKCIFAVGSYDEAFAKHLIDNDAAVVATRREEVYSKLKNLIENKELIRLYGKKAYECGRRHHEKTKIKKMLHDDIVCAIESKIK